MIGKDLDKEERGGARKEGRKQEVRRSRKYKQAERAGSRKRNH